ncbi:uncharacterized protein I206_103819 [Kwoniella pini CBS 10737]|uniref:Uncharacterized protein n=1 Tax=Kwoniella pini CBS 10737 TaxID=1296096 RepID=A0A1B9HSS6_9TREE|nr:uncharacterized protein I206_07771 [Kwoniella pini CBS 10737]OCF46291.1 hypothetical protein I206_07771 [Kwoniella pini CBS 10737]
MTNYNTIRHKRSQARGLISIPTPTSSSTFMIDQHNTTKESRSRFSGDSLTPNDEYSGLFTSGLYPNCIPNTSPIISSFPSPPKSKSQSQKPLIKSNKYNEIEINTPRRKRSSIIQNTKESVSPKKLKFLGKDNGVDKSLENVIRNLKISNNLQSRWSSSTEGDDLSSSLDDDDDVSGIEIKSRKSNETNRSKFTVKSNKSFSSKTKKFQKSQNIEIDDCQIQNIPPLPPTTPGRSKRMMNGLVRRLGLTPKKNKESINPTIFDRPKSQTAVAPPLPGLPLPLSTEDRTIPKKSSLSTLRSALTKKSSNTTLKSFRSASHPHHPFAVYADEDAPPIPAGLPRPRYQDFIENDLPDCFPSTPRGSGKRTPKSSIGQPKLQPDLSPSKFLNQLPRRAPETPKRDAFDIDRDQHTPYASQSDQGVIKFEEEELGDIVMSPSSPVPDLEGNESMDKSQEIFTPTSIKPTQAQLVIQQTMKSLTRAQKDPQSPFQSDLVNTPTFPPTALNDRHNARPALLNLDPIKKKGALPGLGSPVQIHTRNKKSTQGVSIRSVEPLSMKNVNSLGLPVPLPENRSISRASRKDPLGIMKRFNKSSSKFNSNQEMRFRGGAGDGWSAPFPTSSDLIPFPEPRPSGDTARKLNLGTVESYYDDNLGIFRTTQNSLNISQTRGLLPDFSAPSRTNFTNIVENEIEGMENAESRFGDQFGQIEQSPEYFFQLERSYQDDIDIENDEADDNTRIKKTSGYTIHTMTTGEGVEEWELERYLRDLENDHERGQVV